MGLLDRGRAALVRRQQRAAGREVVYSRGDEAVTLTSWPGSSTLTAAIEDPGSVVVQSDRCYLFAAADLYIGGANVLPMRGDRITETIEGEECVFELMYQDGRPQYEWNDITRKILRVHTKRVKPL